MKGEITAYKHFYLEINKLRRIYFLSIFAFEQTRILSKSKALINPDKFTPFFSNGITENTEEEIRNLLKDKFNNDNEYFVHYNRLRGQTRRYLREMIVIYLISITEVFFQNLYTQLVKKTKIRSDSLDKDYLNNGGGLDRIKEAFKKTFLINFSDIDSSFERIREIFDRRHLIIHSGGKISKKYKIKYTKFFKEEDQLKNNILITPKYLLQSLDIIEVFSLNLMKKISEKHKFTFSY